MAQNQFFQTDGCSFLPRNKRERRRAHSANRASGNFNRPNAAFIDAKFGMHRPVGKAECGDGLARATANRFLSLRGKKRRRDINRFLEETTFPRGGLVE